MNPLSTRLDTYCQSSARYPIMDFEMKERMCVKVPDDQNFDHF
jgi:hypothetical protein